MPLITIVTPCLNQGRFIEGAIRSVLLQGYPRLEYIVLDGGSADGTVDVIRRYEPWITYWRSAADRGQSAAINEGVGRAAGRLVGWLNSDDRFLEGAFQAFAAARAGDPGAVAWCGSGRNVDERGYVESRAKPGGLTFEEMASGPPNRILQPACLIDREAFLGAGGVGEDLTCAFDFALWLDLAEKGRISKVDAEVAEALIHRDAKTQRWSDLTIAEYAVILMRRGLEAEAVRWVRGLMRPHMHLARFARRVFDSPLYRLARPVLRALGIVRRGPHEKA
jgi:glycosyltransferase involved in cell wall biosynthesis